MQSKHTLAVFETGLAISLWALSFVFIKVALQEVSPPTLIVLRMSMGALILGGVAWLRGDYRSWQPSDTGRMVALGLVGVALHQALQVSGQALADASVAAFLASTAPAFLVVFAAWLLRERLWPWQTAGVLLATAGAAFVSVGGQFTLTGREWLNPGNGLVLLSAVVWALFTILNRIMVKERPPALISGGMMFFGTLFTLPWFLTQRGWSELSGLSPVTWWAILYVGILSTGLSFLLYSHALKIAEASRLAAIQNIEPLIATLAAILILNEVLTVPLLVGGAAILAGVYLAERGVPQEVAA